MAHKKSDFITLSFSGNWDADFDYHFYRLDKNGKWSHKFGETRPTDVDDNDKVICDPRSAIIDAKNRGMNYKFAGFMTSNRFKVDIRGPYDPCP